jgi:hypothetical protein
VTRWSFNGKAKSPWGESVRLGGTAGGLSPQTFAGAGHKKPRKGGALLVPTQCKLRSNNAHEATVVWAADVKFDKAIFERKQSVVTTTAHTRSRVKLRTALANNDIARFDGLTTVHFDAQILWVGIATVAGRTASLLVCHDECSLK